MGVGSLAAECPHSGESISPLSCGLLTDFVGRLEDTPQRGWSGCQGRGRACRVGACRQDRSPGTPCLWAEGRLFPQPPGRGYDTHWLRGPVFLETQGGTCGFRDWSGCPSKWPPPPWPCWGLSEVWGNRVTLVPKAGRPPWARSPPQARPRACVPFSASLPAPSLAAAPTEVPGWLWFSPCFSNYVEWAKNSSSGPLFGSYHQRPRAPALAAAPSRSGARPSGDLPCSSDFCPWAFLTPVGQPPPRGPSDLGR